LTYRTLFGKFHFKSPRLNSCKCSAKKTSFSPVVQVLKSRVSPEMAYIESKWASLMSYGMTADLLEEVLPVKVSSSSVYNKSREISKRLENELEKEQYMYVEGCPRDWGNLPPPEEPLTVGIDGGYIHAREGNNRKAGWFEAIVGKCIQEGHQTRRFGFVSGDDKGKRRLYEMLKKQNMQLNQPITFLSDGGDNVRDLQQFLSPEAEYLLDWFHVTMRVTVLKNMSKSVNIEDCDIENEYDRIKWSLWNGNVYNALKILEDLNGDLECEEYENPGKKLEKLRKTSEEFQGYIEANASFIPCYAERYRYGEYISTGFVESTVNELITKRMVKKQQMRWTKEGVVLWFVRKSAIWHFSFSFVPIDVRCRNYYTGNLPMISSYFS